MCVRPPNTRTAKKASKWTSTHSRCHAFKKPSKVYVYTHVHTCVQIHSSVPQTVVDALPLRKGAFSCFYFYYWALHIPFFFKKRKKKEKTHEGILSKRERVWDISVKTSLGSPRFLDLAHQWISAFTKISGCHIEKSLLFFISLYIPVLFCLPRGAV